MAESKYTHIGVLKPTQRKIAILARVLDGGKNIYDLVEYWADREWQKALASGLVTEGMLGAGGASTQHGRDGGEG